MTSHDHDDRLSTLRDLFGTDDVEISEERLRVRSASYPVVDGVIVLMADADRNAPHFAEDIQYTFGAEWEAFPGILPEHQAEFNAYFDLVDLASLAGCRVVDLGCGIGRWSHFVGPHCRELVLIDFSDAIFVARRNLAGRRNALFFKADITRLPFRPGFADFAFSLGVLHHLPVPALDAVRALRGVAPTCLVYLYYALDNRGPHFRALLGIVTAVRSVMSRIRSARVRSALTWLIAAAVYEPLLAIGWAAARFGAERHVPLHDSYAGKTFVRIRQDVYDRFFTRIEQRVSRAEIEGLKDTFDEVVVSPNWPYWHFLCRADPSIRRPDPPSDLP